MERRERVRVDLKLKCRVCPAVGKGLSIWKETENISRTGMLIRWDRPVSGPSFPRPGDAVTIELKLPANPLFGQRFMSFRGSVVRIDSGPGDTALVAVQISKGKLQPALESPPIFEWTVSEVIQ